MNRTIKFRAWDTEDKVMKLPTMFRLHRDTTKNDDNGGKITQIGCNGQDNIEYFNDRIILMQFTGLKDKNGIEVYEGDVVEWDRGGGGGKGEISWNEKLIRFEFIGVGAVSEIAQGNMTWVKVIGNVFENPELIHANL